MRIGRELSPVRSCCAWKTPTTKGKKEQGGDLTYTHRNEQRSQGEEGCKRSKTAYKCGLVHPARNELGGEVKEKTYREVRATEGGDPLILKNPTKKGMAVLLTEKGGEKCPPRKRGVQNKHLQ